MRVIAVRLVDLDHGELGIVPAAEPFVAEIAVDLEDPFHAADEKALENSSGEILRYKSRSRLL